jgi:hypothetical protein
VSEVTHKEIAEMVERNRDEIAAMRRDVQHLTDITEKLVELSETYTALKTGGKFVTWMAKFLAGLLAIWVLVKGGAQFIVEMGKA